MCVCVKKGLIEEQVRACLRNFSCQLQEDSRD